MKNMWNWPTGRARVATDLNDNDGTMADSANWSNDQSFGMDQRIEELYDGNYKSWANLSPLNGLSGGLAKNVQVDTYNEIFAKWKNYFDSHTDDSNLTFYKMHKYPAIVGTTYKIAPQIYYFDSFVDGNGDLVWRAHTDRPVKNVFVSGTDNYNFNATAKTLYDFTFSGGTDFISDLQDETDTVFTGPVEKNSEAGASQIHYMEEKGIIGNTDQARYGHAYANPIGGAFTTNMGRLNPMSSTNTHLEESVIGLYQAANATTPFDNQLETIYDSASFGGFLVNYRDFEYESARTSTESNIGVASVYVPTSTEATALPDTNQWVKWISPGNNEWIDYPVAPTSAQKVNCFNDAVHYYRKGDTDNTFSGRKYVTLYTRSGLPGSSNYQATATQGRLDTEGTYQNLPNRGNHASNLILSTFYALIEVPLVNSSGSNSTVSLDALDVSDTSTLTVTDQDGTSMTMATLRTFLDAQAGDKGLARLRVDSTSNGIGTIYTVGGSSASDILDIHSPTCGDRQFYIPAEDSWNTETERALFVNGYDGTTAGSETLHIGQHFNLGTAFQFDIQDGANGTLYIAIMNPPSPKSDTVLIKHFSMAPTNFYKEEDFLSTEILPDNSNWNVAWHGDDVNNKYSKWWGATYDIASPGDIVYSYQDSSNVTQYGIKSLITLGTTGGSYWPAGSTSAYSYNGTVTDENFTRYPNLTFTVNGSGYIASVATSIASGSPLFWYEPTANAGAAPYGAMQTAGIFDHPEDVLLPIQAKDDEYVAPTVYAEDVFDTDDEWDSDAYSDSKRWPTHIAPAGAKITLTQPSSVTASQNGTKYVRSSGVIRQQLELTYAPMTYDDFREFEAVVEAARGQATPFYLQVTNLDTPGRDILLQRTDTNKDAGLSSPYNFRIREAVSVGDKTVLVEGFPGNQEDAFIRGEYIIGEYGYGNGQLVQVINDNVDANVFGEAKIRLPYGSRVAVGVGTPQYKNPNHVIVTLSDDEFEYNVGTDGLYRFTCRFDFDEFK